MDLGTLKKLINNIDGEFDKCIVEISFDSECLGIMDEETGTVIDEIRIQNYKD